MGAGGGTWKKGQPHWQKKILSELPGDSKCNKKYWTKRTTTQGYTLCNRTGTSVYFVKFRLFIRIGVSNYEVGSKPFFYYTLFFNYTLRLHFQLCCVKNTFKGEMFESFIAADVILDESVPELSSTSLMLFATSRAGKGTTNTFKPSGTSLGSCHGKTHLKKYSNKDMLQTFQCKSTWIFWLVRRTQKCPIGGSPKVFSINKPDN